MEKLDKDKEVITVRGVVAPSEWDLRDEVTAVTIYAHDETEYVVNARYMVKRLMKHMDEEVEATGCISEDEYGNEVFIVADFRALEEDEEGDEEEEEDEDPGDDWEEDEEWGEDDLESEWKDDDDDDWKQRPRKREPR